MITEGHIYYFFIMEVSKF